MSDLDDNTTHTWEIALSALLIPRSTAPPLVRRYFANTIRLSLSNLGYPEAHGCPVAFYSDKHSVFRVNREAPKDQGMTQFGRALAELNIEILCANSSQAKGRVQRVNRTLQDRIVEALRPEDISDIQSGNLYLPEFLERFNGKFGVHAIKPYNLHRLQRGWHAAEASASDA